MIDVNIRMAIDTILQTISSIDFYNRYGEDYGSSEAILAQLKLLRETVMNMIKIGGYDEHDILCFKLMYQHLTYLFEGVRDKCSDDN